MIRPVLAAAAATILALSILAVPAAAQDDSISITPAEDLLDGDMVQIDASTTESTFGTLSLCPAASAPIVGQDVFDLLRLRNVCTGLACFGPEEEVITGLTDLVSESCPVSLSSTLISSISVTVPLPRFTLDGTDCALDPCVVAFNTWDTGSAQGAVGAAVTFDDSAPTTTVAPVPTIEGPTAETTTTTTTISLSAPTTVAPPPTAAPTTPPTVPTEVLGAVETNDGQLALTGAEPTAIAALGAALVAMGTLVTRRSRSSR